MHHRSLRRLTPLFGLALLLACDAAGGEHEAHTGHATPGVKAPVEHAPAVAETPAAPAAAPATAEATPPSDPAPAAKGIQLPEGFRGEPVATRTTPEGLVIDDIEIGTGDEALAGGTVEVHYTGFLDDGTVFDSSVGRGRPIKFDLGIGRVIKGWDQGVAGMKVGGKRKLTIPAELGYGARAKGKIPANSRLTFTVELVSARKPLPEPQGAAAFKGKPVATSKTAGGVEVADYKVGEGAEAKAGDNVVVHYTGTLESDGSEFDSSVKRKQPFSFKLGSGRVIKGWDEGIEGMKVGGLRKLTVPPAMGYGDRDNGKIPPNSTLVFTVELMAIE